MDEHSAAACDVTRLLQEYSQGDAKGLNSAMAIVYAELQGIARHQLRRSKVGHHVQTTDLVHEAYAKLVGGKVQQINNRRHFFAIASRAMRQIVVDTYRADSAAKRGGGMQAITLTASHLLDLNNPQQILLIDAALEQLAEHNPDLAEVVDLACFAGLETSDMAELLETNVRTVQRRLQRAQAWLGRFMQQDS